jgi:hypothetical protein
VASHAKHSRLLVIDADVLRASGGQNAVHATAQACRDYLRGVLDVCPRAYLTDKLSDEWKNHASIFGASWKAAMARRGKLDRADDRPDLEVRRPAQRATLTDVQREAFNKDIHLLEAALQAEGIVVSRDRRLAAIVGEVQKFARKLRSIRFVDPVRETVHDLGR